MEIKDKVKELRESTGMNRKEFCDYFGIPYRTCDRMGKRNKKNAGLCFQTVSLQDKNG